MGRKERYIEIQCGFFFSYRLKDRKSKTVISWSTSVASQETKYHHSWVNPPHVLLKQTWRVKMFLYEQFIFYFFSLQSSGLSMNSSQDSTDNNINELAPSKTRQLHLTAVRRLPGGVGAPPYGFVKVLHFFSKVFLSPKWRSNRMHISDAERRDQRILAHAVAWVHFSLSLPSNLSIKNSCGVEEVRLGFFYNIRCMICKVDSHLNV